MDIKNLKRDSASIEGGMWVDHIPEMGTLRLKVRGLGSTAYARSLEKRRRALDASQFEGDGTVKEEAWDKVVAESLHESVLLDWDGLEDNGRPVQYDRAQAYVWLTDPDYRDFRKAVISAAAKVDRERSKSTDALRKN